MKKIALLIALPLIFAWCIGLWNNKITWNPADFATKWDLQTLQNQIDQLRKDMPVDPAKVEFEATVISNADDINSQLNLIKKKSLQWMTYKVVSSDSDIWKKYIEKTWTKFLPIMITWEEITSTSIAELIPKVARKIGNEYNINLSSLWSKLKTNIKKIYLETPANLPVDWVKWPNDAKVTIIEISDFECPYCSKFYNNTYKQLIDEYWDKIQLRFKNLPLNFHKNAQKSAESAQCAKRQWKFWEMHNKLFENNKKLSDANYKKWALEIWLDVEEFSVCLDSWETADEVAQQAKQAREYWISWTPWFLINNVFLWWAYPFKSFKTIIDAELAK